MASHFGHYSGAVSARLLDVWGHHAPDVLSLAVVGAVVVGLKPPPGALALTVPLALAAVVVTSWLLLRRHDRRLCENCISEMPLDPSKRAASYRLRFQLAHAGGQPGALATYFAVLIGSNFIPGLVGRVVWSLAQLSLIYLMRSYVTHRRLQPWCPWCRQDGGGSEEFDDSVPPPPSDRHQLV
jgi:hypothetical protein